MKKTLQHFIEAIEWDNWKKMEEDEDGEMKEVGHWQVAEVLHCRLEHIKEGSAEIDEMEETIELVQAFIEGITDGMYEIIRKEVRNNGK